MLRIISSNIVLTADDVIRQISKDSYGYYKYVRVNGQYRFGNAGHTDHRALSNGEPVESAAFVNITSEGVEIQGYSMTLKVGPDTQDYEHLPQLLGLPLYDKWAEI